MTEVCCHIDKFVLKNYETSHGLLPSSRVESLHCLFHHGNEDFQHFKHNVPSLNWADGSYSHHVDFFVFTLKVGWNNENPDFSYLATIVFSCLKRHCPYLPIEILAFLKIKDSKNFKDVSLKLITEILDLLVVKSVAFSYERDNKAYLMGKSYIKIAGDNSYGLPRLLSPFSLSLLELDKVHKGVYLSDFSLNKKHLDYIGFATQPMLPKGGVSVWRESHKNFPIRSRLIAFPLSSHVITQFDANISLLDIVEVIPEIVGFLLSRMLLGDLETWLAHYNFPFELPSEVQLDVYLSRRMKGLHHIQSVVKSYNELTFMEFLLTHIPYDFMVKERPTCFMLTYPGFATLFNGLLHNKNENRFARILEVIPFTHHYIYPRYVNPFTAGYCDFLHCGDPNVSWFTLDSDGEGFNFCQEHAEYAFPEKQTGAFKTVDLGYTVKLFCSKQRNHALSIVYKSTDLVGLQKSGVAPKLL